MYYGTSVGMCLHKVVHSECVSTSLTGLIKHDSDNIIWNVMTQLTR